MKTDSFLITTSGTSSNNIQIFLEGQLVIRNVTAIKRELLRALNSFQSLELVFRNIIKIDLAVLQVLIALQKSAARVEKKLSFDIELTDYIKSVLQNSGLENILAMNFKKPG